MTHHSDDDPRSDHNLAQEIDALMALAAFEQDIETEFCYAPNGIDDEFWQAKYDAIKTQKGIKSLWYEHAFIMRWGTAEELDAKAQALDALLDWWAERQTDFDAEAVRGLESAQARLRHVCEVAARVEATLQLRGCTLDPETRLLMGVGGRGRRRTVLSACVTEIFDRLVKNEGRPQKNTAKVRREIAARLADKFHPDLLDPGKGGKLDSAVNGHLNLNRERRNRGKRGGKKRG